MTDNVKSITEELIDGIVQSDKIIQSGRSSGKLVFADQDTPRGKYLIVEIRIGTKGITLITDKKLPNGRLAFFESHGSPLCDYLLNSANSITLLSAVVNSEVSYAFGKNGGYVIDAKMWKIA